MTTALYVPGTSETDPKKTIMSLQLVASQAAANTDKLKNIYFATDFDAIGDGVTDNFSSLQSAIVAASGGELYIPAGTYAVTVPSAATYATPGANTVIRGAGKYNTTIVFNTGSFEGFSIFILSNAGVEFHDLTIQISSTQGSFSSSGLVLFNLAANAPVFQNCRFIGDTVDGATISGSATSADQIKLTFTSSSLTGSPITVAYTVATGNTTAQMAMGLAAAVNANGVLSAAGVAAVATGSFVGITQASTLAPRASFTGTVTGVATETITIGTSTDEIVWLVGSSETSDFLAHNVDVSGMSWTVLKSNASTTTNRRWKFIGGYYNNNANGHMNLNSPNGVFDDVLIMGIAGGEVSPNLTNGLPIAGSRITGMKVIGNRLSGTYNQNAMHFEEGCAGLIVSNNSVSRFTSASLGAGYNGTGIFVTDNNVSGSYLGCNNLTITGNNIASANANNSGYGLWTSLISVAQNGATITGNLFAGFFNGIELDASQNYSVTGNIIRAFVAAGTGIKLSNGPGVVSGNTISAYTTPLTNLSSSAVVTENPGYNPVGSSAAVTMGASPFTYTAGGSPETHYVNQSATNTATIAKGGQQIAALANASTYYTVELGPNESYVTTWTTTAPKYTKDIH